ncbi:MAG: SRPBCC family protein [Acidobacteriota bacterium]
MSKKPTGQLRGNDLILTRSFHAPIEDVWASVTQSERTERWFAKWEGDARPGNTIRIKMVFEPGDAWKDATIDACEAPHHLELTTKGPYGSHLELTLREANGVTELVFVHHLSDRGGVGDYGPGWEYYLDNLVASREGVMLPKFEEYYPSQKAYYLAQAN